MSRVEILERIRTAVAASPDEVVAVYLYGSYARDTATAGRDIDLGLLLTAPPEPKLGNVLREVEAAIEERLGRQVEAVALNRAAPEGTPPTRRAQGPARSPCPPPF